MRRSVVSVEQTEMLNGRLHPKREGENNCRGRRRRRHCGLARRARNRVFVGALMRIDVLSSMKCSRLLLGVLAIMASVKAELNGFELRQSIQFSRSIANMGECYVRSAGSRSILCELMDFENFA
jgi:hypothetical protein